MSYKILGDYIRKVDNKNKDMKVLNLQGLSMTKEFRKSTSNIVGTDLSKYKIVKQGQFCCDFMSVIRVHKLPVVLNNLGEDVIISPAYIVFEVIDENLLLPEYLMLWFRRTEFDRYADFRCDSSIRGGFQWEELCEVELPVPSIEKQREIVAQYQAVANKIKVNEEICEKLEATAQTLYKQWFVDFEFPCLPSGYRPHGQVNQNLPIDEYITKIGSVCTYSRVGGLPVSDGKTWFVYLILCENDSVYKGITNDLYRRFYEHYMGEGAEWTKLNKPLKVIHWESFATKEEAAKREKDLKTGYGRTWISSQIEKAGGITQLKTSLPAPQTELRTAGKMVYNQELEKEIPEGWEVGKLSDFIQIKNGKVRPENVGKIPVYGGNGIIDYVDKSNYSNINIIGRVGAYCGAVYFNESSVWVSDNALAALSKLHTLYHDYLLLNFLNLNSRSEGSSHPLLTQGILNNIQVLISKNEKIYIEFENIISPFFKDLSVIKLQNQKLTQLQSLLLSRLARLEG